MKNHQYQILTILFLLVFIGCQFKSNKLKYSDTLKDKIPTKEFNINSTSDTMLLGPHGVYVYIPSNAFKTPPNYSTKDSISIQISGALSTSEFYKSHFNNKAEYPTFDNHEAMFIQATYKGQVLSLTNNKTLFIHYPSQDSSNFKMDSIDWSDPTPLLEEEELDIGYKNYYGQAINDSEISWKIDSLHPLKKAMTIHSWRLFNGNFFMPMIKQMPQENNQISFREYLATIQCSDSTSLEIDKYSDFAEFGLRIEFTINTKGQIESPRFDNHINPSAKKELTSILLNFPVLEPIRNNNGIPIPFEESISIKNRPVNQHLTNLEYLKYRQNKFKDKMDGFWIVSYANYKIIGFSKLGWLMTSSK